MQSPIGVIFEKGKVVLVSGELEYDVMYTITDWNPASEQFTIEDVEEGEYDGKEVWAIDFNEATYMDVEFNDFTLIYENPDLSKRVPGGVIFESGKAKMDSCMESYYDLDKEYKIAKYWKEAELFSCIDNDGDLFWFVFDTENTSEDFEDVFDNYKGSATFVYDEAEFYEVW